MKNIKSKIVNILSFTFIAVVMTSCNDRGFDEYDEVLSSTTSMNGEWFIDISDEEGTVYAQHTLHKTADSGNNDGKMLITDRIPIAPGFSGWFLEGFVSTDTQNLTFNVAGEENLADGSVFTITEGKILKNAARSQSGNVVDSIYFKGEFDYDPGTIIIFAGHRRTGFEEDEY